MGIQFVFTPYPTLNYLMSSIAVLVLRRDGQPYYDLIPTYRLDIILYL